MTGVCLWWFWIALSDQRLQSRVRKQDERVQQWLSQQELDTLRRSQLRRLRESQKSGEREARSSRSRTDSSGTPE